MAFLDLDEFMYGRQETIAKYLQRVPSDIARLEVGSCPNADPGIPEDACNGEIAKFLPVQRYLC